ncbi:MAG: tetratricopeptide repeat protein [Acidobacteria bacterium]|nr:tetratricopeptide repeat protein [Acidobacteriota bacterium]
MHQQAPSRRCRFGAFELDLCTDELWQGPTRLKVPDQSIQILKRLLDKPGDLITREELRERLWPSGTFVDYEHGLNAAVRRLREALGDSADGPRYIETLPRRGYRFIAPVERIRINDAPPPVSTDPAPGSTALPAQEGTPTVSWASWAARWHRSRTTSMAAIAKVAAAVIAGGGLLLLGAVWTAGSWRLRAPEAIPSLAVLPFKTIGGGDEYFADGITEAVTTELGRVGGLRVIASNSAFAYRDSTALSDVARELGVGLVVRGSVQRNGGTVRIDVSLVDAHDERALWSDFFSSREVTDVLTVQNEISRQVAMTISKRFGVASMETSPSIGTRNPEAYEAYLRGLWHLKGRSSPRNDGATAETRRFEAIEELQRAVTHDSNFALARAALASAYAQRFFYDATEPSLEQQAFFEIKRALAINPNQAEAYLARAQLSWTVANEFHHEQAVGDLRHALSINPNLAEAYVELGKVYYHIGLTDKAVDANDQAHRLDPSDAKPSDRRLRALIDDGRLEEFRRELDGKASRVADYSRADGLVALGRLTEALQLLSRSSSADPKNPDADAGAIALRAVVYARLTQFDDAERMLSAVIPAAGNSTALSHLHHAQFHIGSALALLGRYNEALLWLNRAVNEGYPSYPRFSKDESLAALKGHAEFDALLVRLRQDWERWRKTL